MHSFCITFVLMVASAAAAGIGGKAQYVGGTLDVANGLEGRLLTASPDELIFASRGANVEVPYQRINLVEYGQQVGRRVAMAVAISPLLIMSKARKHFVTIGFTDASGQQQAMVFRLDKEDVRVILASLEARTGVKITYQDEEARKAGKG
jgi:hypothetical protein